jgi:S-methylmethionine-dependent homocysteine/selenocysteine methylase
VIAGGQNGPPLVVLDGPIGTMLEQRGVPTPAPLWSAAALRTHPEEIARLHRAYADAGATVHTAATFRTSPYVAGDDAAALTALAVQLARGSVPATHAVAGSLAPLEDCWRPERSPPDAGRWHRRTAALLADAGVDLILVETFANVDEAVAATQAASETGLPVWTALTPGPEGRLLLPERVGASAARVREAGAEVVLLNCLPAARAERWAKPLAAHGGRWGVYANAGPRADGMWHGDPGAAVRYAAFSEQWRTLGACVIGGCCFTGPDHIRAICQAVDPY